MQRMGMCIGVRADRIDDYKRLHAAVWPGVLARLSASNIKNYSIYLKEPENILFGTWDYHGSDFAADAAAITADRVTRDWWALCEPMQVPFAPRREGEWWSMMEEVFHLD